MSLKSRTYLSPIQNSFFQATWAWLAAHTDLDFERDAATTDDPDVLFMCGLPTGQEAHRLVPLVAPVLALDRYGGQPVYFSDLVARSGTAGPPAPSWRIAYNSQDSFSGWIAPRSGLASLGIDPDKIRWVATGSHMDSLAAIRTGAVEAAGIDSMVMDLVDGEANSAGDLVTIESFGPWPAPPISARAGLDPSVRDELADTLASMHEDAAGARVLAAWGVALLAPVEAADYERLAEFAANSRNPMTQPEGTKDA